MVSRFCFVRNCREKTRKAQEGLRDAGRSLRPEDRGLGTEHQPARGSFAASLRDRRAFAGQRAAVTGHSPGRAVGRLNWKSLRYPHHNSVLSESKHQKAERTKISIHPSEINASRAEGWKAFGRRPAATARARCLAGLSPRRVQSERGSRSAEQPGRAAVPSPPARTRCAPSRTTPPSCITHSSHLTICDHNSGGVSAREKSGNAICALGFLSAFRSLFFPSPLPISLP